MEPSASNIQEKQTGDERVIDVDNEETNEPVIDVDERNNDGAARRSFVWQHFTYEKGAIKSKCPYCKTMIGCCPKKNGTCAMGNHLKFVCLTSPLYKQTVDNKKQSTLGYKPTSLGELASHSFNQANCRKYVARMCIKDNQPFSIVDDDGFKELLWNVNPMFKLPSRWTVARDCLSIYKEEKNKLKHLLQNQTVSLTTDTWTSVQNFNYMCLTAHWVDDNWWKLNSVRFPILSRVARHVLGMPISTVASESAFSTGGRVIDKYRSSLTPTTSEALICTQDWIRSSPADLQDIPVCGQLEDMVESLENLEIDLFPRGKASRNDDMLDEDSD